ncbi:MAG TPA: thioredoxin domain-containing protein [Vicinamibacterales bacterium]|nr:thioredoxin domain-containing protein [Vicinamibacterales bacterium]
MQTSRLSQPVGDEDHVIGPRNAPVTLVEYGDFACPSCAMACRILQEVLPDLGDDVRFVYRHFPLAEVHPNALAAAEAAESVARRAGPDAFWIMYDLLFENQDALQEDDLLAYAEAAGAPAADVANDVASAAARDHIARDIASGDCSGVTGTPAFFINGRRFDGDWRDPVAFADALRAAARTTTH